MKNRILNKSIIFLSAIVFLLMLIPNFSQANGAVAPNDVPKVISDQLYTLPETVTFQVNTPGIGNDKGSCKALVKESIQYSAYNLSNIDKYYIRMKKVSDDVMEISLRMEYKITREQNNASLTFAKEWVARNVNKNMSEEQKIHHIFDYVRKNFTYKAENPSTSRLLEQRAGNCTSFSGLVEILAKEAGIDTYFVFAQEPNHGWNLVKIDGNWYHLDATYGLYDAHVPTNYLVSDSVMQGAGRNWTRPYLPAAPANFAK